MRFKMINQGFEALGRKYQVLPNFEICCREAESHELSCMLAQFLLCLLHNVTLINK